MSNKNLENNLHLKKQKVKLALFFSVIVFLILFSLQVFFQTFRYVDYKNSVEARFREQFLVLQKVSDIGEDFSNFRDILKPRIFEKIKNSLEMAPPEAREGRKIDNFIIYNESNLELENTFIDRDFASYILSEALKNNKKNEIFDLYVNETEYHVINKSLGKGKSIILFSEEKIDLDDVLWELFLYFIIASIFSVLLYFIVYSFVNRILTPVEQNLKDMEDFIHNAGHELKTPISVVKSSLQLAKLKKSYEEEVDESISELDKMDMLIDGLLKLSLLNNNLENNDCKIEEIIEESIKLYETKINDKKINLIFNKNFPLSLKINREYGKIFFSNLLSNAIKYNKIGGEIEITINKNSIIIKDTGIGIKSENIDKVWNRFFQETEARNQNGFGIGLSLVKKIREIYKWKIKLETKEGEGTKIIVNV